MRKIVIGATGLALALGLAACSSDSETTAPAESASPSASQTTEGPGMMVGTDPSTWTPVSVTMDDNGSVIRVVNNQSGVIDGLPAMDDLNQYEVITSDPTVVEAIQPTSGDWVGNPGFTAVGVGTADLMVINTAAPADDAGASNVVLQFTVAVEPDSMSGSDSTVTDSTIMGSDPATWAPVMIAPNDTTLTLVKGQHAVFPDYEYSSDMNYTVMSSDMAIVDVENASDSMVPSIIASDPGTATVTVFSGTDAAGDVVEVQSVEVEVQ